ncbi:MAG: hypothetical protein ACPGNV_04105 [Mangrovicoccus sp.]
MAYVTQVSKIIAGLSLALIAGCVSQSPNDVALEPVPLSNDNVLLQPSTDDASVDPTSLDVTMEGGDSAVLLPLEPAPEPSEAELAARAAANASGACNAEFYAYMVGGPIGAVQHVPYAGPIRVLGADEFVTRDFNPQRLTFTTRPDDTVGRVFCG